MTVALARPAAVQPPERLQLELEDYAALPITGELDGQNTRGQLARVNYLRDEPGVARDALDRTLSASGLTARAVRPIAPSLEDVFIARITGSATS